MVKPTLFVSVSGGKTSMKMAKLLKDKKSNNLNLIFTFANTGLEHEETLVFLNRCDKEFNLGVVWLEAVISKIKGVGVRHKIVDFETASRNGEPFESQIEKEGIPNVQFPKCSERLKRFVMESYKRSVGFRSLHMTAIGIRSDEVDRMNHDLMQKKAVCYPLVSEFPETKKSVNKWWSEQDFNLNIPEHYGNCVTCFKKSDRKLFTIAKHTPEYFDFFKRMEIKHGRSGTVRDGDDDRKFFRGYRSSDQIIASSKGAFNEFVEDGETFEQIDLEFGCGSSCDAY